MIYYEMKKHTGTVDEVVVDYHGQLVDYVLLRRPGNSSDLWHPRTVLEADEYFKDASIVGEGTWLVTAPEGGFVDVFEDEASFYPVFAKFFRGEFVKRVELPACKEAFSQTPYVTHDWLWGNTYGLGSSDWNDCWHSAFCGVKERGNITKITVCDMIKHVVSEIRPKKQKHFFDWMIKKGLITDAYQVTGKCGEES